jgi:hypothetical protein
MDEFNRGREEEPEEEAPSRAGPSRARVQEECHSEEPLR